eukprot:2976676-Lingulodinium_polyedra.AAC.1
MQSSVFAPDVRAHMSIIVCIGSFSVKLSYRCRIIAPHTVFVGHEYACEEAWREAPSRVIGVACVRQCCD